LLASIQLEVIDSLLRRWKSQQLHIVILPAMIITPFVNYAEATFAALGGL